MARKSVIDWGKWHTNNYWRLGQRDRLRMLCYLKQSGFRTDITTIGLSLTQLRSLVLNWSLVLNSSSPDTGGKLVKLPEQPSHRNSAQPTFAKFMALPAELRCRVYDIHFDWLADHLKPYTGGIITEEYPAPPITQIDKLIREESFPLFQDRRTSIIGYCWHNPAPREQRPILYTQPTALSFSNFRNIKLDLEYTEEVAYWASMHASCIISISKDAQSAKVGTMSVEEIEIMVAPTDMLEKTREKIKEIIDKKILATGGFVFQTLDMLRFGQGWWEALGETGYRR